MCHEAQNFVSFMWKQLSASENPILYSNADMFYLAAWPHWPTSIGENPVCTPVSEQKLMCDIVDIRLYLSVTVAHAHKCSITALLFVTNISIVSIMLKWNTDKLL